ncbi:MAG TPA: homoserine O-acetyltransferase [Acidimicrobiia bacterium]|jgi:homoserine O-acetyltransferase
MPEGVGSVSTKFFTFGSADRPFVLMNGAALPEVTLAYETYGALNEARDNAVLVFHALTGSHHAAGHNPSLPEVGTRWTEEYHVGWWDDFIGPGKAVDTDKWFVICANYLGGCYGSTGPTSIDPATGVPYSSRFPRVRFGDMVDTQVELARSLGIEKLHAAIGGSTGGFMVLSLATRYPDFVDVAVPIASGLRTTSLHTLLNFEQMNAIYADPDFRGGDYHVERPPNRGLALARIISHKSFISLKDLRLRARDEVIETSDQPGALPIEHPLESYMWHQGAKFVDRFDANSYLRIVDAWQNFDLVTEAGVEDMSEVFVACKHQRYLVFSIDSDVCYYQDEQQEMVEYLETADVPNRWITVHSDKGHDSFLLEPDLYAPHLANTLSGW